MSDVEIAEADRRREALEKELVTANGEALKLECYISGLFWLQMKARGRGIDQENQPHRRKTTP